MIIEYHRPETIEDTLNLMMREQPVTYPLGGGTVLNRPSQGAFAVVDLQALGLDTVQAAGNVLPIGATTRLQDLLDYLIDAGLLQGLRKAILLEGTHNLRQLATVAGALISTDGRSPFAVAMLALDSEFTLEPGERNLRYGDLVAQPKRDFKHHLVTRVTIQTNVRLAFDYVARSPMDLPIVCSAVAIWPSGRTRVALGGYGGSPALAYDGTEAQGADIAAQSAYHEAGDQWASSEYRREIAGILTGRAVAELGGGE